MRDNPPPGWPTPPAGWEPDAGWTPDPSWPPSPPGWQLWVVDNPAVRLRFNLPPGWPSPPPDWSPAQGWQPDPTWPPAPKDWQFWIPSFAIPQSQLLARAPTMWGPQANSQGATRTPDPSAPYPNAPIPLGYARQPPRWQPHPSLPPPPPGRRSSDSLNAVDAVFSVLEWLFRIFVSVIVTGFGVLCFFYSASDEAAASGGTVLGIIAGIVSIAYAIWIMTGHAYLIILST